MPPAAEEPSHGLQAAHGWQARTAQLWVVQGAALAGCSCRPRGGTHLCRQPRYEGCQAEGHGHLLGAAMGTAAGFVAARAAVCGLWGRCVCSSQA